MGPRILLRPSGRWSRRRGLWWPRTVSATGRRGLLLAPHVGYTWTTGLLGGLSEKPPRLLSLLLLQVVPIVNLSCLEAGRIFPLLLQERLKLKFLLLFKLPRIVLLLLLKMFFLLVMDYLHFIHQVLNFVHHLVSVGFIDVGAEGHLSASIIFRYWSYRKHFVQHWLLFAVSQTYTCVLIAHTGYTAARALASIKPELHYLDMCTTPTLTSFKFSKDTDSRPSSRINCDSPNTSI